MSINIVKDKNKEKINIEAIDVILNDNDGMNNLEDVLNEMGKNTIQNIEEINTSVIKNSNDINDISESVSEINNEIKNISEKVSLNTENMNGFITNISKNEQETSKNEQDIIELNKELNDLLNTPSSNVNPNLLTNSTFQIFQRSKNYENPYIFLYEGFQRKDSFFYTLDRWMFKGSIQVFSGCPVLIGRYGSEYPGTFKQILPYDVAKKISGKKVTLSLKVSDNEPFKSIWIGKTENGVFSYIATKSISTYSDLLSYLTVDMPDIITDENSTTRFEVGFDIKFKSDANGVYINYAKLEMGDKATPIVNRIYADEIAECRKYYLGSQASDVVYIGQKTEGGRLRVSVNIPKMARKPTVEGYNANSSYTEVYSNGKWIKTGAGDWDIVEYTEGKMTLELTKDYTGLTENKFYSIRCLSRFDADIY